MTCKAAYGMALLALLLTLGTTVHAQPPYRHARGVIHLDSTVSGGDYTPEQMVEYLREYGVEVAVFTDHDTVRWDYGFFPARYLIGRLTGWVIGKAFGRDSSVQSYGPGRYLAELDALDAKYGDMVILPGVEAIPFFYWDGSLLFNSLTLHGGYKHLLAFGMAEAKDYADLPSVGEGFFRDLGFSSFLSLWPVAVLFLGLRLLRTDGLAGPTRVGGIALLVVSGLFLLQNFPFAFGRYDQYGGHRGTAPYQDFIDYVTDRGGLVFWAHPEIEVDKVIRKPPLEVRMKTDAYYQDLLYTGGYTGFSAFYEGMKYCIPPGGIWDRVLDQYCTGVRESPVWAIAEGDVEGDHFEPTLSQTVFLLNEFSRGEALEALREGRVYAMAGPLARYLRLDGFTIEGDGAAAVSGQTVRAQGGRVRIRARATVSENPTGRSLKMVLVKDGRIMHTATGTGSVEIDLEDHQLDEGRKNAYRIDVHAPAQSRILSNPIFVQRGAAP